MRAPNQPSSITNSSTPILAAFSASAVCPGFVDVELGGFPRVVEHRPGLVPASRRAGYSRVETVQHARRLAETRVGVAAIEGRGLELFAGLQRIGKVESVVSAGDAHLLVRRLLNGEPPIPAPAERPEPNPAVVLIGA